MEAETTAETSTAGAQLKGRRVLTKEASAFLLDYARNTNSHPNKQEKLHLLERVRQYPGCEAYTIEKLKSWFNYHRRGGKGIHDNVHSSAVMSPTDSFANDASILFPSLTPAVLRHLDALLKARPDPNDATISIWASRLGAPHNDVVAWIDYQKAISHSRSDSEHLSSMSPVVQRPHLPTPSKSVSPSVTPMNRNISLPPIEVKHEPSTADSPVISRLSPPRNPIHLPSNSSLFRVALPPSSDVANKLDKAPPLRRKRDDSTIPSHIPPPAPPPAPKISPITLLGNNIRHIISSSAASSTDAAVPTTISEFDAKFHLCEGKMKQFIHDVEQGNLRHLGWGPSLTESTL
ncbi:hypothetical protein BV22DRAFT_1034197 [Leucogyrophana mollusca]|uniref:Uncharacterized protein n=1 Tax=Leucogyrophana mollusca TaxID=85980 RepID=A0ACB8BIG2_9AGAM|nr:hypothetical protein BV22DRAFT_1034197 [Leucogyrophana mollusca]